MQHNPQQFLTQFRQALSADKLAVGFLLGAGCPCSIRVPTPNGQDEPLIADIRGLTKQIDVAVRADQHATTAYTKLTTVFDEDGQPAPTIEQILNRVRALRDVAGKANVRGLSFTELDVLDKVICLLIRDAVSKTIEGTDSPYHSLARFVALRHFPQCELFTTNYDLLMERALESERVPFFDGFVGSSTPFFDQRAIEDDTLPARWARLWKLHGSINWRIREPQRWVVRSENCDDGDELLIHPSHMKYDESRRMPYFVMIDRLRAFLRNGERPVALVIVGYSFSDQHLNEAIVESLRYNPSSTCFALQYGSLADYADGAALANSVPNLSLLAFDGAIIRRRSGTWAASPTIDVGSLASAFNVASVEVGADPEAAIPCTMKLGNFKHLGGFLDEFASYSARRSGLEL